LQLGLLVTGCVLVPTRSDIAAPTEPAMVRQCRDWYAALDTLILLHGVRDASGTPIPGFPHLRVDRFTASLRDHLTGAADPDKAEAVRAALLGRLLALDRHARGFEIANLPPQAWHDIGTATDPVQPLKRTRDCGQMLLAADLARPAATDAMLRTLSVPDDYVTAYRVLGLYGLTRIPFLAGVRQWQAQTLARFGSSEAGAPTRTRLRLAPPRRPDPHRVTQENLRRMLQPAATDPLAIPAPTPEQLDTLFEHFAPEFDIGVLSNDDRPGALVWPSAKRTPARDEPPRVDSRQPVVYRHVAYTRYGRQSLLQLVYTLWFAARPISTQPIDLLAGRLDGLVWRVTLSPDGQPLVYDSIHPCGCYHLFFPGPLVSALAPPDPHGEWAFSPRRVPALEPTQHLVLRIAPGTHYLDGLDVSAAARGTSYGWRDYDELRAMADGTGQQRSVFDSAGFVAGTERAESWLFWPMGIERAGTMRQWGRHPTAFVGRRHFDDARLMERRFAPWTASGN
jgi:hypothetical protein